MYLSRVTTNVSYNCNIISHNAKLIHREDGNYFMAIATVSTQGQNTPILQKYMKADVRIIVSNKNVVAAGIWIVYVRTLVAISIKVRFPILVESPWHVNQYWDNLRTI